MLSLTAWRGDRRARRTGSLSSSKPSISTYDHDAEHHQRDRDADAAVLVVEVGLAAELARVSMMPNRNSTITAPM